MRVITKRIELFTFKEANKELRDKIRDSFSTIYNIYEHSTQERIETLKGVAKFINGKLDYTISFDFLRGNYIKITEFDNALLRDLMNSEESCPLTGVCYDDDIIELLKKGISLQETLENYLKSIHDEYEEMLKDDSLLDHCEANEYEFTIDGKIY